jgi:3-oxoacyl-[acyl-carrier-protein] synthase II
MNKRVVITGYGAICSLGESVNEIWDAIMDYQIGYQKVSFPNDNVNAKFFGFIEPDKNRYKGLPKSILKLSPDFSKYAMFASKQALTMAFGEGVQPSDVVDPFDFGVIIGTGWGGVDNVNYNNIDFRESGIATSFSTLMSMNSVATAAVSLAWNLRGYQNTPVAACATGTMAIGDAFEVIKSGRQKVILAGGSESLKEHFNVWSIDVIQALSKEQENPAQACCPFDSKRSGFVLSEGAAVLCLEELDHALERNAKILGEITGYANYSDAFDMTAPAEDMGARVKSIEAALSQAQITPNDINYVNLHGTSTPLNDKNESNSLKRALGEQAYNIPMSSTKSYSGHLIGAAGSLEAIICLKTLETGIIPATVHLTDPDPECDLDYIPNKHRQLERVDTALNLSFGFGGANCALVIKKFKQ